MTWAPHIEEFVYISNISLIPLLKVKGLSSRKNIISKISSNDEVGVLLQANHVNGGLLGTRTPDLSVMSRLL